MNNVDVVILTDARYVNPLQPNAYTQQILNEEALIQTALKQYGLTSLRRDWADPQFDWQSTRLALLHTTWDYFVRLAEFKQWLELAEKETLIINHPSQVRWNWDKHYLLDLQAQGINIPPTHLLELGTTLELASLLPQLGWDEAVLKPTVSGSARHTYHITCDNANSYQAIAQQLLESESLMLQPFQHQVVTQGELSLIMIEGQYSHAVRKVARTGDFRVQDDHGGRAYAYEPTPQEIAFAQQAVEACHPQPIYARVDIIRDNQGQLALMELELIEPELFLRFHPSAATLLAKAIAKVLT